MRGKVVKILSKAVLIAFTLTSIVIPLKAEAKGGAFERIWNGLIPAGKSATVSATGSIEVAFSPDEGAEELVLKTINAAQSEIRMLTYSFTSAPVVEALIRAKKRGVDVALVADKSNLSERGKGRAALAALVNAGCDVRVISVYSIHHDKVIVVDRKNVEVGSFNYSSSAAHKNSENVLVNWNNPELAEIYLKHFEKNQRLAKVFHPY